MNKWSRTSAKRLNTCHVDLITLCNIVLQVHDCTIVEGHRNQKCQNQAYYIGNSKLQWPNSKHNKTPSLAVDVVPFINGKATYNREQILYFSGIVLGIANRLSIEGLMTHKVRWGGDWDRDNDFKEHKFFDGAHFELVV